MWAIVVAVGVILLGGVGVYAYVTNTPDYLLNSAAKHLASDNSLAGDFVLDQVNAQKHTFVSGDFAAYADPKNNQNGQLTLGVGQGDKRVSVTIRLVDKTLYFQPTGLLNLGRLADSDRAGEGALYQSSQIQAGLKLLDNQWFNARPRDINGFSGSGTISDQPTAADLKQLQDIYNKHPFFVIDQNKGDESVSGVKSLHLVLKIDRVRLVDYLKAVKQANLQSIKVTDADIESTQKDQTLNDLLVEVWIARNSKTFEQIKFINAKDKSGLTVHLKSDRLKSKPAITKPENTKNLDELYDAVLRPGVAPGEVGVPRPAPTSSDELDNLDNLSQ